MTETVLITGCSTGIGRATAELFFEEEGSVWATSRDESDVADLAEMGCQTASLDVTDEEQCATIVERVMEEDGRIDALVNNAGYAQYGPVEDVPTEKVHAQFDVNVYGPHRLVRAVLPYMRAAGDGTIVNVSSVFGRISIPGNGVYSASKHALEGLTDAMRAEVDEFGVDVVLVEPGPVDTSFDDRALASLADVDRTDAYAWLYDTYEDASIVSRSNPFALTPEEVATAIVDAASVTDPEPRYPVGPLAKYVGLAELLPGRVRDLGYRLARRLIRHGG